MIRFFRKFVGGKSRWVERLRPEFKGAPFTEVFCGSAALSANLAGDAILNDADPVLVKIHQRFDEQIVPPLFSVVDYEAVRWTPNWWRWAYCMSHFSFGGKFMYSGFGFSGPPVRHAPPIDLRPKYAKSLERWRCLRPTVLNLDYRELKDGYFDDRVVVMDPPYEGSGASYNSDEFDYVGYWTFIQHVASLARATIVFDRETNIRDYLGVAYETCTMSRPDKGSAGGDTEAMTILR